MKFKVKFVAGAKFLESSITFENKTAPGSPPFLINVIFDPSFPVEMFGEAGSRTGKV